MVAGSIKIDGLARRHVQEQRAIGSGLHGDHIGGRRGHTGAAHAMPVVLARRPIGIDAQAALLWIRYTVC